MKKNRKLENHSRRPGCQPAGIYGIRSLKKGRNLLEQKTDSVPMYFFLQERLSILSTDDILIIPRAENRLFRSPIQFPYRNKILSRSMPII